jgi:ATP-binding cassette subfamily F protein uup
MDATSTRKNNKNQNRVRKILHEINKAQSRRKENKVELEINMERMGSKIIELHNQEIQGPCHHG